MNQLEWIRVAPGFAKTSCGRYQMSITGTAKAPRYICLFVTGEPSEPFRNIGQAFNAGSARAICEEHNRQQQGAAP